MDVTTFNLKQELIVPDLDEAIIVNFETLYPENKIPKDLAVKEDYAAVKEGLALGRKLKLTLETWRKAEGKEALAYQRKVNGHAKAIDTRLLDVITPMKTAKTEFDAKVELEKREKARRKEEREDAIDDRIAEIRNLPAVHISSTPAEIEAAIDSLLGVPSWADEFAEKAEKAAKEASAALMDLLALKVAAEEAEIIAAKAEKERLAAEKEAKKQRERELAEMAEKNRIEADKLAKDRAEIEAEKDRLAAEVAKVEAAKQRALAVEDEKKRIEKDVLEEEAFARAQKDHAAASRKDIALKQEKCVTALTKFVPLPVASKIGMAIFDGEIPFVRFEG